MDKFLKLLKIINQTAVFFGVLADRLSAALTQRLLPPAACRGWGMKD
jgi:hypothetical protein